jgi:hypothetical protein
MDYFKHNRSSTLESPFASVLPCQARIPAAIYPAHEFPVPNAIETPHPAAPERKAQVWPRSLTPRRYVTRRGHDGSAPSRCGWGRAGDRARLEGAPGTERGPRGGEATEAYLGEQGWGEQEPVRASALF